MGQVHFGSLGPANSILLSGWSIQIFQVLQIHQLDQVGRLQVFPCILAEQRVVPVVKGQLQVPPCAMSVVGRVVLGSALGLGGS